jgi:hypothetical protein
VDLTSQEVLDLIAKGAAIKGGVRWPSDIKVTYVGRGPLPTDVVVTFHDGYSNEAVIHESIKTADELEDEEIPF